MTDELRAALLAVDAVDCEGDLVLDRERPAVTRATERIRAQVEHALEQDRRRVVLAVRAARKAAGDEDEQEARAVDCSALQEPIRAELEVVARDAAQLGMLQVDVDEIDALLSQSNEHATLWAARRAGELVTEIESTTRQGISDLTLTAEDEGWANDRLADALSSSSLFSASRAMTIARTETAMADVQGNLIGWAASGVVEGKRWVVADANECDDCAAMDGEVVPLDEDFDEGDPPLHPRCRCDLLPVLDLDSEE